ncbi:substrate-binding domain-containing protein [Devosia sp. YR412]|uniref:substrate-binding domain-containing protein n=1 Tax=Devosia sp. YR412 TaxID=1881030 RepID=UPI001480CC78|nr:substrate-binding domain-containing protein [Devosia sp. YR412]
MELIEILREAALSAEPGSRFPTLRELMSRYGATQYAVHTALKALNAEGVLISQVGSGSIVADHQAQGAGKPAKQPRILLLHHRGRSEKGDMIGDALHQDLLDHGYRMVSIAYGNGEDLTSLVGDGSFDVCVLQPRSSLISTKMLEIARRCARFVVVEGRNLDGMEFDVVARDRRASLRLALRHLWSLGHHRVGLLSDIKDDGSEPNDYEQMFDFWSEFAAPSQNPPFIHRMANDDTQKETLSRVFHAWKAMAESARPTALVVYGRIPATTLLEVSKDAGVSIPNDLGVLRICSTSIESLHGDFFTTAGRSAESVAATIAELVDWRLANPNAGPRTTRVRPHLVTRSSIAARL